MDDGTHARPSLHWNSVTDAGGSPSADADAPPERSRFQFDLGGALARLGGNDASDEAGSVTDPATPEPAPTEAPDDGPAIEDRADDVPTDDTLTDDTLTDDLPTTDVPDADVSPVAAAPADVVLDAPAATDEDPLAALRGLMDESARGPDVEAAPPVPAPPPATQPVAPPAPEMTATPPVVEPPPPFAPDPPGPISEPISEPMPHDLPVRSRRSQPASVFDEVAAAPPEAPALPSTPSPPPAVAAAPVAPTVTDAPAAPAPDPAAAAPTLPGTPAEAPALPETPVMPELPDAAPAAPSPVGLPTLPDAPPAASPIITEAPTTATATPDIHALRSAQLRADRRQHKGRLFGRAVLAFFLIAVLIGAALIFGRSYLFPTEWNAALTPVVDEIQEARGADFDHTVPLEVLPEDQFAELVVFATLGSDVTDRLPIWRAAGLADGTASFDQIAAALAERFPVVYDAEADTIYQLADADPARVTAELRIVLADVFERQRDGVVATRDPASETGFAGVSSSSFIAERAVDVYASGGRAPLGEATAPALPIPILYELEAIDLLGEAVLVGANVDPASFDRGAAYPETLATVLDDAAANTASGLVRPGERSLADPIALGVDDWSLVWGAHLPGATVDQLTDIVTADSFRPIDREGATCFLGVFQAATDTDGSQLYSAMLRWSLSAPEGAQALATQLGTTRVQLEACDPGQGATTADAGVVSGLITRQIERLAR